MFQLLESASLSTFNPHIGLFKLTSQPLSTPGSFTSSYLAGLVIHGPLRHLWIEWMQVNLDFNGAWWNTLVKVRRRRSTMTARPCVESAWFQLVENTVLSRHWFQHVNMHLYFKVAADQTGWSLFLNSAYTTCIMGLQGRAPRPTQLIDQHGLLVTTIL